MRNWSLARQMLVLQLAVVVVTLTGAVALMLVETRDLLTAEAEGSARAVAVSVANSPDVLSALGEANPSVRLQPYAERVRAGTGVDFITIMDTRGRRYTHPNPGRIGGLFLGHIDRALRGETFTETYTGTLGPSVRAVAPVKDPAGAIRALVSAGITVERIDARLREQLSWAGLVGALGLGVAAGGTWLVGARLRRQTHGLGPVELGRIHEHHDAILHAVREGLLLVARDGTLTLCNDGARTLLGLPSDAEGRHVADLGIADLVASLPDDPRPAPTPRPTTPGSSPHSQGTEPKPPPALPHPGKPESPGSPALQEAEPESPSSQETGPKSPPALPRPTEPESTAGNLMEDRVHLVGDRVLVVNAAPSRLGTVVTLRDRTELQALTGQLDAERGFADSLRAAAHESANRLHTVITLVELGRTEQAVAFGTAELKAAQELTDRVVGAVREPVLAALLLGKSAEAAERGAELVITPDSELDDLGLDPRQVVTIVGNLIDNAIEAAGRVEVHLHADEESLVIRVADDGPGLADTAAFAKGWTSKGDGRGLGLALVGQAVRRLGGTIEVAGSTFTVTVPR
ncbi:ATP-binding protein [Nonomuraea sp. NPDC059194]|uniref:ATP-binding protein n=1 Tax=Nonomuraea sp. NPDC059194 TaxID=3346764 RepID=UPI0036B2D17B